MAIMLLLCCAASAQPQVELPLGGNYRPGRLMPILFTQPTSGSVTIRAEGMIPTRVLPATRIAHVLLLGATANTVHIEGLGGGAVDLPLHPLDENERLIGIVGGSGNAASLQPLFPDRTIITLPIDSVEGTPDSLDAVVIDSDRKDAQTALACGTVVAMRGQKPAWDAPLERIGEFWVIKPTLCGPTNAIGGEEAYLPAMAWQHGWPAEMRRRIVLAGVLVSLLALATLLVRRPRVQAISIVVVAVVCTICIELWRRGTAVVQTASGTIRVWDQQDIVQTDQWKYFWGGCSGALITFRDRDPIVFDREHAQSINLSLTCDPQGQEWSASLPANATLATLRRTFSLQEQSESGMQPIEISSPMRELARRAYLRPGLDIKGEEKTDSDWATVIIAPEP